MIKLLKNNTVTFFLYSIIHRDKYRLVENLMLKNYLLENKN